LLIGGFRFIERGNIEGRNALLEYVQRMNLPVNRGA